MITATLPSLEHVLTYQNEDVVWRFVETYKVSLEDAEEIFTEMKRWLWLCAKRRLEIEAGDKKDLNIPLFNDAKAIDLMWHTFLLYTQDYADFCQNYFGTFIHHMPRSKAGRIAWQKRLNEDPEGAKKERQAQLREVYDFLYEELGKDILIKWTIDFPKRFHF